MKKIVAVLLIALLVASAAYLVKKRKAELKKEGYPIAPELVARTVEPKVGSVKQTFMVIGKVVSDASPKISTKVSGYIERVFVSESQKVKKGQLLFKIDSTELRNSIAALKTKAESLKEAIAAQNYSLEALKEELALTERNLKRTENLYSKGGVSYQKVDELKTKVSIQKAKIDATRKEIQSKELLLNSTLKEISSKEALLPYFQVRSPCDATVAKVFLKEGDLAVPGKPVLELLCGVKKLVFSFPQDLKLKRGSEVFALGKELKVSKVYPLAKDGLKTAEIVLKQTDAATGELIPVKIILSSAKGCVVPTDSILRTKKATYVLEKVGNSFKAVKVRVLAQNCTEAVVEPKLQLPVAVGSPSKLSLILAGSR